MKTIYVIRKEKAGFRRSKSTLEQIFALNLEKKMSSRLNGMQACIIASY